MDYFMFLFQKETLSRRVTIFPFPLHDYRYATLITANRIQSIKTAM